MNKLPLYVVKRLDSSKKKIWIIRVIGFLLAFLISGIICAIFRPGTFFKYYEQMFIGCFDPSDISTIIELLALIAVYFLMALVLAPAFRMKYWNIGGEGQTLMGCLAAAGVLKFLPASVDTWPALGIALVASLVASVLWSTIPAIFKAFFNTNETLFTLMMNYIATGIVGLAISIWITNGSQSFGILPESRRMPLIAELDYLLPIIIIAVVSVIVVVYLLKSKHGYEISVVGSSQNTAKYVGINVKKVIIRTLIISGLLSGLLGFLLVSGIKLTLNDSLVGGKGFTGVLICWLGHFNPFEMILYSALVSIFEQGSAFAATTIGMSSDEFSKIITGMFFFIVIACEFFANYKIKVRKHEIIQEAVSGAETQIETNSELTVSSKVKEKEAK